MAGFFQFGPFLIDAGKRQLIREGRVIPLSPKAFDTLLVLVNNSDQVLEKDKLMDLIWPDSQVEEANLALHISALRKALGESPNERRYIITVPGRGYRFRGPVSEPGVTETAAESDSVRPVVDDAPAHKTIAQGGSVEGSDARKPVSEGPLGLSGIPAPARQGSVTLPADGQTSEAKTPEVDSALAGDPDYDLIVGRYKKQTLTIQQSELPSEAKSPASPALPARTRLTLRVIGIVSVAIFIGLSAIVLSFRKRDARVRPDVGIDSIAVLPLKQLGAADDDYLGVGIADSLITRLSNIREIKVRPTSAVLKYAQTPAAASKVCSDLGVAAVLEGTIRRSGDNIRVTIQLLTANDQSPVWAQQFDDRFTDLFEIEDSIADRMADSLALKLTGEERGALNRRYTANSDAYQLYLKGRYQFNKRTRETIEQAIGFFRQATEKDPTYALAFAGLSDAYAALPITSDAPPGDAFPKARHAADQGLKLDSGLAETNTSAGYIEFYYDWNWPAAESHLKRALEINPNYALAHFYYALLLSSAERFDQAGAEAKRALELDPVSVSFTALSGQFEFEARHYDQAVVEARKALAIEPNFWIAHIVLGKVFIQQKKYGEALHELQKAFEYSGGNTETTALIGYASALSGNRAKAEQVLAELIELSKRRYVPASNIALIYVALGDNLHALDWLEKAAADRDVHIALIRVVSNWDPLRQDPRFIKVASRLVL